MKSSSFHQPPTIELELYCPGPKRGGLPPGKTLEAAHPEIGSGIGSRRAAA